MIRDRRRSQLYMTASFPPLKNEKWITCFHCGCCGFFFLFFFFGHGTAVIFTQTIYSIPARSHCQPNLARRHPFPTTENGFHLAPSPFNLDYFLHCHCHCHIPPSCIDIRTREIVVGNSHKRRAILPPLPHCPPRTCTGG